MSDQNLEAVREVYSHWSRGDFSAGTQFFDEATAFVLSADFPDAGVYIGPRVLGEYMRSFLEPWKLLSVEALDLSVVGDTIVAEVQQQGEGKQSGAFTGFRYFQLWSFRGRTLLRLENLMSREEAMEAVR